MKKNIRMILQFTYGLILVVFLSDNVWASYNREGLSMLTLWEGFIVLGGLYFMVDATIEFMRKQSSRKDSKSFK